MKLLVEAGVDVVVLDSSQVYNVIVCVCMMCCMCDVLCVRVRVCVCACICFVLCCAVFQLSCFLFTHFFFGIIVWF